jgi:hypothetical protein
VIVTWAREGGGNGEIDNRYGVTIEDDKNILKL